jgi:glycosyltransferase involved in cell wall biosynthesis
MKFSILLPTRDRLELLRLAVESVRIQEDADWEIVISDNRSAADVAGYVAALDDARVQYMRTPALLPVTDNWNAALERSRGDYVIMLGDDDALMRGCLGEARRLIGEFGQPDALYAQALQYAYPGVIPGHAQGFVQIGYNAFLGDARAPFRLPRATALEMVRSALAFRIRYGYNMQHFVFSRRLVEALADKGPFFQSPYPDYYAANAILLGAASVVATPRPLVMIGVSPKSFGYYYANRREGEGVAFLQNDAPQAQRARLRHVLVPGSDMNDSWLCAMEALAANFPAEGLRVDHARYRLLQFNALLRQHGRRGIVMVLRHMRFSEMLRYAPLLLAYLAAWLLPPAQRRRAQESLRAGLSAYPRFDLGRRTVPWRDILEAVRGYVG